MARLIVDARRLEQYREAVGISQSELARRLGITYEMYWGLTKNEESPGNKTIAGFAVITGASIPFCIVVEDKPAQSVS